MGRKALLGGGLAVVLLAVVVPRGVRGGEDYPYFSLSGVAPDILIVLDASRSMDVRVPAGTQDPDAPKRYEIARDVIVDMVAAFPEVRWGLARTLDVPHAACQRGVTEIPIGSYPKGPATTDAFKSLLEEPRPPAGSGIAYRGPKDLEGGLMAAYNEWLRAISEDGERDCRKKAMIIITGGGHDYVTCSYVDLVTLVQKIYGAAPEAGGLGAIESYVIGFNLEDDASCETLDMMAEAGQGLDPVPESCADFDPTSDDPDPYDADDISQFYVALSYVLNNIIYGSYTNTNPVLSPSGTDLYQAYFDILPNNEAVAWRGHIADYILDENGAILSKRADLADWLNNSSYPYTDRQKHTFTAQETGGLDNFQLMAFSTNNAGVLEPELDVQDTWFEDCTDTGISEPNERAETIIRFILGDDSLYYSDCWVHRESWKLLDIFHSTPTLVTPPWAPSTDPDYFVFQETYADRSDMLVVGSNGGMLHAFQAAVNVDKMRYPADGREIWAYIPRHLLPKLKLLWDMFPHPIFMDATPTIRDVKIHLPGDATDLEWHTVAVFGNGIEGDESDCDVLDPDYHCGYFTALDMTKENLIDPLWEFAGDGDIIAAVAQPTIAQVRVETSGFSTGQIRTLAFLPGKGRFDAPIPSSPIYVVDLEASQGDDYVAKIELPWRQPVATDINHGIRGRVLTVDTTGDMLADRLYVGDMEGRLWRVDISSPDPEDWMDLDAQEVVFDPREVGAPDLPITYPVTAVYAPDGAILVYFGTGDPTTAHAGYPAGAFYGLLDSRMLGEDVHVLDGSDGDWPLYFAENEVLSGEPIVVNQVIYFTTYCPSGTQCYTGSGKLYAVHYLTAEGKFQVSDSQPDLTAKYIDLGHGIPSSVIVGYDRWYVAMNNAAVGDSDDGGIASGGPEGIGGGGSSVGTFYGELRPYAWIEVSGY